jgi:hypothetical protein
MAILIAFDGAKRNAGWTAFGYWRLRSRTVLRRHCASAKEREIGAGVFTPRIPRNASRTTAFDAAANT